MADQMKVSVCFAVPVASATPKEVKAAYKELAKQITAFSEAVILDSNILALHSNVHTMTPGSPVPFTADYKIAELQTISKKVTSGKSSVDKPKQDSVATVAPEENEDEDFLEKPRVVAGHWEPPAGAGKPVIEVEAVVSTATPTSDNGTAIKEAIFKKSRRTEKSEAIVDFFIAQKNAEVTLDDISKKTKLGKQDISVWFQSTGKTIKGIGKVKGKRGVYIFDASKIKV